MEHNSNIRTTKMKYNSKDINNNKYEVQFKTSDRQIWNASVGATALFLVGSVLRLSATSHLSDSFVQKKQKIQVCQIALYKNTKKHQKYKEARSSEMNIASVLQVVLVYDDLIQSMCALHNPAWTMEP